ncbi:MAG: hypothetical protein ACE5HL_05350 [Terriglobia bacterium]
MRLVKLLKSWVLLVVLLAVSAACTVHPERKKAESLESGERYYQEGRYQEVMVQLRNAVADLREAIRLAPESPAGYIGLAKCLSLRKEP